MILLNGALVNERAASISPLAPGFMFGIGAFTTVRVRAGRAEFLALHAQRIAGDVCALGLAPVSDVEELRARCEACIAANAIHDGGIKIVWFADENGGTGEIIGPRPHGYVADTLTRGLRLMRLPCASRAGRELARHKTLNYLEHLRGKRAAVAAGFDDGLWVTEAGVVLEGTTCSLFAVIDGEMLTPASSDGLLPGVARRVVLELGGALRVREATLTMAMLATAEEVFATNALMGVAPVRAVDGQVYPPTWHSVTQAVQAAFEQAAASG